MREYEAEIKECLDIVSLTSLLSIIENKNLSY